MLRPAARIRRTSSWRSSSTTRRSIADLGTELGRPRRLTAAEGFALAASARAILAVPGADPDGALGRALAKLEAVLGGPGPAARRPARAGASGRDPRRHRRRDANSSCSYYSASSDRESTRIVDPVSVRLIEGHWYLDGYCHNADRACGGSASTGSPRRASPGSPPAITATRPTEGRPDDSSAPSEAFVPGPEATVAHLAVDDDAVWITEALLNSSSEPRADGRTGVTLAVASTVWFGRLLLRLGPHAEVLDPPELAETGRQAARQLLTRYRSNATSLTCRPSRSRAPVEAERSRRGH